LKLSTNKVHFLSRPFNNIPSIFELEIPLFLFFIFSGGQINDAATEKGEEEDKIKN